MLVGHHLCIVATHSVFALVAGSYGTLTVKGMEAPGVTAIVVVPW